MSNNQTSGLKNSQSATLATGTSLIKINIQGLSEGAEMLKLLNSEQYTSGFKPAFQSTIGAHYRHILEHYRCLFKQLDSGEFCYDSRERDQLLEQDRDYAFLTIDQITQNLTDINTELLLKGCFIRDQYAIGELATTLSRELLFLQSHTVHHYAIIAAQSRAIGVQPKDDFGVAIATLNFQHKQARVSTPDAAESKQTVAVENLNPQTDQQPERA